MLANHFTDYFSKRNQKTVTGISERARELMMNYSWPGNIREPEHLIERSVLLCKGEIIQDLYLPENHFPGTV